MDTNKVVCMLVIIGLVGCQSGVQNKQTVRLNKDKQKTYINSLFQYSVQIPVEAFQSPRSSTGASLGFINYDHWIVPPPTSGYFIGIDAIIDHSPCSPSLTGASKTTPLPATNGKTEWGKVDYWHIYHNFDFPNSITPICKPGNSKNGGGYALCSQNDGKVVLICISEMTDNPDLAKQIFNSFKWTK